MWASSPPEPLKVTLCVVVVEPSVAGSSFRHTPAASAVAVSGAWLSIVTVTVVPA